MNNTAYDIVVVGGGNAAMCAALSAREHGANVLVLERAPLEQRGGNTAFAGGSLRIVHHGFKDIIKFLPNLTAEQIANTDFGEYTAEQFLDDLARVTEYRVDPDLAETLVHRSAETVQWIRQKTMIDFLPEYGHQAFKHEGRYQFKSGHVMHPQGGGRGLIDAEFTAAEKQGVNIRYNARAMSLLYGRDGVEGVRVVTNRASEEIRASAVVLACGGFESNREWRTRYLGPGWDLAKVRGTRFNTGDGIGMALKIGAQPCGNWSGAHACEWDLNAPDYGDLAVGGGYGRHSGHFGIVLNAHGLRIFDEGNNSQNQAYGSYSQMILGQPGQFCWQVFDSKAQGLLRSTYRTKQATKVTANTLDEFINKLKGVNKEQALKTIKEYNAAVRQDVLFNPNGKDGRGTFGLAIPKSNWANTIDTPPFEGYAVTWGVTLTFGGLKITTNAQVVDTEEKPIPGLYAAGGIVGGIFYFNYPGGSGLVNAAVFGRLAGENAAYYAVRR